MNDEIVIHQPAQQGLSALGGIEEMARRLDENSQRLAMVQQYIEDNFVKGIDFGPADQRNPKPVLLKPGAEKVCKLFNTTPRWRMDRDTREMAGNPDGVFFYICEIIDNATGAIVGEGRGAEKLGNKQRDHNKAIKIAEKCALIDAALYTFNLSERFTQDLPGQVDNLNSEKNQLMAVVEEIRAGVESKLTTGQFMKLVSKDFLHGQATTVGAVRKLREVIEAGMYDLTTAERAKK